MALLGPLPKPAWFGNAAMLGYIIAVRLTAAVLGNVFVFGGGHAYDVYRAGEARWDISPAGDQVAAGRGDDGRGLARDARAASAGCSCARRARPTSARSSSSTRAHTASS